MTRDEMIVALEAQHRKLTIDLERAYVSQAIGESTRFTVQGALYSLNTAIAGLRREAAAEKEAVL